MKSLHQIKNALTSVLSTYHPREGLAAAAGRVITRGNAGALSDQYLENLQAIQNQVIQNIAAAKTMEAVVAALVFMTAELRKARGAGLAFGTFEKCVLDALTQFTDKDKGSYFSELLVRSGLKEYFCGSLHNVESGSLSPINSNMIITFFSVFDEKFFALFSEDSRLSCVSQLLRAKSNEAFQEALVNLVWTKLVDESNKFSIFSDNSAIVSFASSLNSALAQCRQVDVAVISNDFNQRLISEIQRKSATSQNRKLKKAVARMREALNPTHAVATAPAEDQKAFSFLSLFKKPIESSASQKASSSSNADFRPDSYQIKMLPTSAVEKIERTVKVNPNDSISYYNIARNNPLDLVAVGAEERQAFMQTSELAKNQDSGALQKASGSLKKAGEIGDFRQQKEKLYRARLYCHLVTPEFISQIKKNFLTKTLKQYFKEASDLYIQTKEKKQKEQLKKTVIFRYEMCLEIAQIQGGSFVYQTEDQDLTNLLSSYKSQAKLDPAIPQDNSSLIRENSVAEKITTHIKTTCSSIETALQSITGRVIEDDGLIAYDAKSLERLAASYRLLVKCNEVDETSELSQDLRVQGDILARAFLEKIKQVMQKPVALQQQFKAAVELNSNLALVGYIPKFPGYSLEIIETQEEFDRRDKIPTRTYWIKNSSTLCQTDAKGGVRIFDEVEYLSERIKPNSTLEEIKTVLEHTLLSRGGHSIYDRTLSSVLNGVDTIDESSIELLRFDARSQEQYEKIVHTFPCGFNMGVFFILQYASQDELKQLLEVTNNSGGMIALQPDLVNRLVLPKSIYQVTEALLKSKHRNAGEILDLLRQLSAIFITINQLEKLDNFNDGGLLQQILMLPDIIAALKKELQEQRNILGELAGDAHLNALIRAIDNETTNIQQYFSEKFSAYRFGSDDLLEEVLPYVGRVGTPNDKYVYFQRLMGKISSSNNHITAQEKLAAIEKYTKELDVELSDDIIAGLVPVFIGLMSRKGEIFLPELDKLLNKISSKQIKEDCIKKYQELIVNLFSEMFDTIKARFSAGQLLDWVHDFSGKVSKSGATLGYKFEVTDERCVEKFIGHYLSVNVNNEVNEKFSVDGVFEEKFLKCSADLISKQMIERQFDGSANYISYVNKVSEQLLQHYVTWLKNPRSVDSNNAEFNSELKFILNRTVYTGCTRKTFIQDQIALSISKKDFSDARVLLSRLYTDSANVIQSNVSSIIQLLESSASVGANAFEVFLSPIKQEDRVFCDLLQQVINDKVMHANVITKVRDIHGPGLILVNEVSSAAAAVSRMDVAEAVVNIEGDYSAAAAAVLVQRLNQANVTLAREKEKILAQLNAMKEAVEAYNVLPKANRSGVANNVLGEINRLISSVDADPFALTSDKINVFQRSINDAKAAITAEYKILSVTRSRLYRILNSDVFSDSKFSEIASAVTNIDNKQAEKASAEAVFSNLNVINQFKAVNFNVVVFSRASYEEIFQAATHCDLQQKNIVANKIRGTFESLVTQLRAFPSEINFPLKNIIYLIKLSQELDKSIQPKLTDFVKEKLNEFFDQYNIEALIARAFSPSMDDEQLENIKKLVKIQKIAEALNAGNIPIELNFADINTPADFALEAEKRKYLDSWAFGRRNQPSESFCKAALEAFIRVSSRALDVVAEETSEAFSARLWESIGDKTLLQRYKFKIWNCFQEDLNNASAANYANKIQFLRGIEAGFQGIVSVEMLKVHLPSWIEGQSDGAIKNKLSYIGLCLDGLGDQDSFDSRIMALLIKAFSGEGLTDQKRIVLVKEAFSLLSFVPFPSGNHDVLIGQINAFFLDESRLTQFGEFYRNDSVLRQMMKLYERKINIAVIFQQRATSVFSQNERELVNKFYINSCSVLSDFLGENNNSAGSENANTVHTRINEFYRQCVSNNGDSIVSLDQLCLQLNQWSKQLRKTSLSSMIDDIVIDAESCKKAILFQRKCDQLSGGAVIQSSALAAASAVEVKVVSVPENAFIAKVCDIANSIKPNTSREYIQEIVLPYFAADKHISVEEHILAIYTLATWYKEKTDSSQKIFTKDAVKNKALINQYNELMTNLKSLLKIDGSLVSAELISEIKDQISFLKTICRALELNRTKSGLDKSSLSKLINAMEVQVDKLLMMKNSKSSSSVVARDPTIHEFLLPTSSNKNAALPSVDTSTSTVTSGFRLFSGKVARRTDVGLAAEKTGLAAEKTGLVAK